VGLEVKGRVIMGSELEKMGEAQFAKTIYENNIFARITPEQKFKIVGGLTKQGHIVGFLGDGVNDAPALKVADVGITVDSAVDVAKDSADIILLQKGLLIIAEGIKEGRKTFGNIMKYVLNTISANFGNMFSMTISSLWLPFIPLLPSQVLLNNLISDGPLTTISTDNVDEDYLHKPKKWNIRAISHFMVFFGLISTVFDLMTMAIMWSLSAGNVALFRTAWFLESVLSEIIITFAIRTRREFWKSRPSRMLLYSSIIGIALSVGIIYPPLGFLFQFEGLSLPVLAAIAWILFAYFVLAEVLKRIFYRKYEL
jgi:Mg2+-importing ATPase